MPTHDQINPLVSQALDIGGRVRHGFFNRNGGVSSGIYTGLNVGIGSADDRSNVLENRRRVAKWFGRLPENLSTVYQVHSPDVLVVDKPLGHKRPKADALVTRTPGIIAGVLTADCGPVLFADHENRVIGAAHAGWKGATGGVLENTVEAMENLGARRKTITAVIGPTISKENYEVGPEFVDRLISLDRDNDKWLTSSPTKGHAMFDLPGYIVNRLENNGVTASWTGHCTYDDEGRFYSYRRKTHRNEPDYGRQIAAICID